MRALPVFTLGLCLALSLPVVLERPLHAQPASAKEAAKDTARALMDEGDRLVEEKRLEEALATYERAHALVHAPTTGLEVARTRARMGRLVEAIDAAVEVSQLPRADVEPKPFVAARREAEELAARLSLRIATVQLDLDRELDPNRVRVEIDASVVPIGVVTAPRAVNPGRRVIRVSSPGRVAKTFTVDLREGGRTRLRVVLEESSAEGGLPPLAIVGLGLAGVGLLVGSITGIVSLGQASDARTACGPVTSDCDPAARSAIRDAKTTGWISTISFGLALGGGGLAAHALLTRDKGTSPASTMSALPRPPGFSLGGAF